MELAGVIVCGGSSTRMGTDKACIQIGGERLLDRVARRVSVVAEPVVIAPGRAGRYGPLPWMEVDDAVPEAGPAAGVIAALGAVSGLTALGVVSAELVAAVAVDMPDPSPALLLRLATLWSGEVAVVPVAAGRHQWLHAVWSTAAHGNLLERLRGGSRSFADLTGGLPVRQVRVADDSFATNLNRPEDLNDRRLRS